MDPLPLSALALRADINASSLRGVLLDYAAPVGMVSGMRKAEHLGLELGGVSLCWQAVNDGNLLLAHSRVMHLTDAGSEGT